MYKLSSLLFFCFFFTATDAQLPLIKKEVRVGTRKKNPSIARTRSPVKSKKSLTTESSKKKIDKIVGQIAANMVLINGGSFKMGSDSGAVDEKPKHNVTLSNFYISRFEVTEAEWRAVLGTNPSMINGYCDNCPVENVSYYDAVSFCEKLSLQTGKNYRLPTEAEWEYAAGNGAKHTKSSLTLSLAVAIKLET